MNTLFDERLVRRFNLLLLPVALIWSAVSVFDFWVDPMPVEHYPHDEQQPFSDLYRFSGLFGITPELSGTEGYKTVTKTVPVPVPHRLKAVLKTPEGGLVTVFDGQSSTVVPLLGHYKKEFILTRIGFKEAVFTARGKSYRLRLGHDDPLDVLQTIKVSIANPNATAGSNEWRSLPRAELLARSGDLSALDKAIAITPVQGEGFRVDKIVSGSIFERFGLRQGDIIREINNQKFMTYADAFSLYRQIPHMHNICISITRDHLSKDLIYEITR